MERTGELDGRGIRRRWMGIGAVAGSVLVASALGIASAGAASQSPGVLPGEPNVPWDDGAIAAVSRADLVGVHPRRWDHILFAPDGRTANVYFSMGPETCEGFSGIEATPTDTGYRILVMTGDVPGAPAECPATAQLYRSVVVLDDRLVTGGELLDLPGGLVSAPG
jgi:hypothetical protein